MQLINNFRILVSDGKSNNAPHLSPTPHEKKHTWKKMGLVHDEFKFSLDWARVDLMNSGMLYRFLNYTPPPKKSNRNFVPLNKNFLSNCIFKILISTFTILFQTFPIRKSGGPLSRYCVPCTLHHSQNCT